MSAVPGSVVIVGGGVGGVSTAASLRASGFEGTITLVEASEVPYDRPPLSKGYLAGRQSLGDIALQRPGWYDEQSVRLVGSTLAVGLQPADRSVELSTGQTVRADHVVLATGGHAARPPVPGVDSPRVHVLRDYQQADALRAALVPGARLLVVGGGLIGAETASTASELGVEVTLIDPAPVPLEAAVGPELGDWLHGMHATKGITTISAALEELEDTGSEVLARYSGVDEAQPFDVVLIGVGLRPETSLADSIGLEVDRGIVVDAGQRTRCPGVLAVGDPTRRRIDGVLLPRAEHWEAAQHDGARAAATILGAEPPAGTAPWFWSDRHGVHLEGVGHMAEATSRVIRGCLDAPPFSVWGLRGQRVVAVAAVGDSTAVRAGRRMIDRHTAVIAAQLADTDCDLRRLLRGHS
jgi:3-phenylpropionate/trans-cinnamate dioxygenase ferredoxin reductase component